MTFLISHLTLMMYLWQVLSLSSFTDEKAASERPHREGMKGLGFKCSSFSELGFILLPWAACPVLGGGEVHLLSCQVHMSSHSVWSLTVDCGEEEVIKRTHCRNEHRNCTCPCLNQNVLIVLLALIFIFLTRKLVIIEKHCKANVLCFG